jgi:helicase
LTVESIEAFDSAYISNRLVTRIAKAIKTNVSTRLFADSTRTILTSGEVLAKLDPQYVDKILAMQIDFMDCKCKERPFCRCLEKNISHKILRRRLQGWSPNRISKEFMSLYDIHIYPGDIFTWLDQAIRTLEAISRIAYAFNNKKVSDNCNRLIKKIEQGK